MKNSIEMVNQTLFWRKTLLVFALLATLVLMLWPDLSFAAGDAKAFGGSIDDLGVPGVKSTNSITKNLALILSFIGFILIFAAFATGLPETIMTFFRNLNDARKNEDWGVLLRYLGMVLGVIVVVFIIIAIYNKLVVDTANGL